MSGTLAQISSYTRQNGVDRDHLVDGFLLWNLMSQALVPGLLHPFKGSLVD